MKNIIILQNEEELKAYSSLTNLCDEFNQFSYHYLKAKKYPFRYKGYNFIKLIIIR